MCFKFKKNKKNPSYIYIYIYIYMLYLYAFFLNLALLESRKDIFRAILVVKSRSKYNRNCEECMNVRNHKYTHTSAPKRLKEIC